jgi:Chaperone of endosialidase
MNPSIQLKATPPLLITVALLFVCFGVSQKVQAVVPPPGGGYPNFTTAEGTNTIGQRNTATGDSAMFSNTTGSRNTATGNAALGFNMTGDENTATGAFALNSNTEGNSNVAIGGNALNANTTGSSNTATGVQALLHNTIGNNNAANGLNALFSNTSGIANTAMGNQTLQSNTTGSLNTALGNGAGNSVTTADHVIAIGTAGANVSDSCYIGNIWNQPGGSQAVYVNSEGKLGAQVSSRRFKDEIKPMEQTSEVIYGLKPVSFRYKPEIEPTRPVGFGLIAEDVEKISPDLVTRGGDGKVNSVRHDAVNAMLLNEFLKEHKTVQEQGATIAQQRKDFEAAIAQQQKEIEALTATVKEQAAQIQSVGAQLELSESAPQTVLNNQ